MDCEKYQDIALEEIDGELENSRALLLMRHLVSCDSCRMHYERHSRLYDMMHEEISRELISVPESFSASVMSCIEDEGSQAVKLHDYGSSVLFGLRSRIKSLDFSFPSLYPLAAFSLVLVVAAAGINYVKTETNDTSMQPLTNARAIKAERLDKKVLTAEADSDALNYYISRHAAKAHSPSGSSVSRKAGLIYTSYNPGKK